ncbi:MAG: MoaD/ThiS family protein [SAR324 cluster bacterium]|nr:MoaD/ThiS family protein [SAR324 cluster bacterium]
MATVHIPSLLRDLTGGAEQLQVDISEGERITVREVLDGLEQRFPGMRARLLDAQGELAPHLAVFIDGEQAGMGLMAKVGAENDLFFLAPIVGGV